MRLKPIFPVCLLVLLCASRTDAQAQRLADVDPLNRAVYFDPSYMATQLLSSVEPVLPGLDPERGTYWSVNFDVLIGTNGRVKAAVPASPSNEPYTSASKNALMRWTWKPQLVNGVPVEVKTTVAVAFDHHPPAFGSPQSIVDSDSASAVGIILKSGSAIHADTVRKDGDTVSYTIDEQEYEIPNALVEQIVSKNTAAPTAASSGSATAKGPTAGQDSAFRLSAELRHDCETHTYQNSSHPELATAGDVCSALQANMGAFYDAGVDRAIQSEQTLCASDTGPVNSQPPPKDAHLAALRESFQATFLDVQKYQASLADQLKDPKTDAANSADQRRAELARVTLDIARLSVACKGPATAIK
jgi:hypothetical protein